MGPEGHIQSLDLVMGAVSDAQWVQKGSLKRVFFSLKSPFLRVVSVKFLVSNVTNEAVIYGWNGSYGLMGTGGHVRCLDLVMGAMPGGQWARNDRLTPSFFA